MANIETKYLGLQLANPFIVSSSGFTRSLEGIRRCAEAGAGAVVMKSLFEEEIRSASTDLARTENFHPEVMDYLRSEMELEYHAEDYFTTIREAKKKVDIPIIASLNAATGRWWVQYAKSIENAGADAIELNLYLAGMDMNVDSAVLEDEFIATIAAVRDAVQLPVSVKISRYFTSIPGIVSRIKKANANGVVLFNRFVQPDIDIDNFSIRSSPFLDDPVGLHYGLRWISFLYGKTPLSLAASGGVRDFADLTKYLLAGADAVQSCSVLYNRGLGVIDEILSGLKRWMDEKGFSSLPEVVGKASQENTRMPEEYLRAQYVKAVVEADGV
jgi:dihydroorotate dehydrogenase (fumarate)